MRNEERGMSEKESDTFASFPIPRDAFLGVGTT